MKYAIKLLEDNKALMTENLKLRVNTEKTVHLNLKILQENEELKQERAKLMKDTMTLIEYNDILLNTKENLERDVADIRKKFEVIVSGMTKLGPEGEEEATQEEGEKTT